MASGRVGGTKAKISGTIGNQTYSIRRNSDGSYTQVVQAKRESGASKRTTKLAAQQMIVASVEYMMKELRPVFTISFQSGKNKSKSLNAASTWNIVRMQEDAKAHWFKNMIFDYNRKDEKGVCLGQWMISSGTLHTNFFIEVKEYDKWYSPSRWFSSVFGTSANQFVGLVFPWESTWSTCRDFFKAINFNFLSSMVLVIQSYGVVGYDPEYEEDIFGAWFDYYIFKIIDDSRLDKTLSPANLQACFNVDGADNWEVAIDIANKHVLLGAVDRSEYMDWGAELAGGFSISYASGRKQVSSSVLTDVDNRVYDESTYSSPDWAIRSWMDNPDEYDGTNPYL